MKESRYNVMVPRPDGGAVLYNTLYGSLTQLAPAEVGPINAALRDPTGAPAETVSVLATQRHLVDAGADELAAVARRRSAGIHDRQRLDVIVMTTLDCNFDCIYCYETRHHGSRMSEETESRLVAFLEREIPQSTLTILQWFGGEPLLDTPLIVRVGRRAGEIARIAGSEVTMHATTNGYLLEGWRRDELLAAGVLDYQITLDGPAATHDRMRPTRGGGPTFDRVFANITETVLADPRVGMTVRINVNHQNLAQAVDLLPAFEPAVRPRIRLALEPIFGDSTVSATENIAARELSAAIGDIYRVAGELGFDTSAATSGLPTGRLTYCYAERDRQLVVNYDGSVFKCTTSEFDPELRLASLGPGGVIESHGGAWERWMSRGEQFPGRCRECVYLPLCMGGCRARQTQSDPDTCTLVPTNAQYVLKQIGLDGVPHDLVDRNVRDSVALAQKGGDEA